jgi:uncharacterized protein YndB with AHSA1/START domain/DNA-binding transcriptional ArsR family regulator
MDAPLLIALAEPNRLRIVELLGAGPRAVGEVADELDIRQPQATKHLQALERAGLVTAHPFGRRRIYALRREPLRDLRDWLDGLAGDHPSELALADYARAVAAEQAMAERDPAWAEGRTLHVAARMPAAPTTVWRHWTDAALVRRWWHPDHFKVAGCTVEPKPGGALAITLQEGDGTRHESAGRFLALDRPRALSFQLAPLGPGGGPLFTATHDVRIARRGRASDVDMVVRVTDAVPAAAPALAGLRIGWEQLLERLAGPVAPS